MTPALVETFLGLTGDSNPLHSDRAFAEARRFQGPIVPAGLGSAAIMRCMPLSWDDLGSDLEFVFVRPLYVGERFVVRSFADPRDGVIAVLERTTGETCVALRLVEGV
jgi:acyl dehydratase